MTGVIDQPDPVRKLIQSERYSEALTELQSLLAATPEDALLQARTGIVYQKLGNYSAAEKHYLQAQRIKPDFPEVLNNLSVLYKETGRYEEGLVYIEKALRILPDAPDYLNNRGTLLLKLNQFSDAQRCFERTLELNPRYVAGYLNLSNTFLARHDLDQAMNYIQKALALNPKGIEENWNRALLNLFSGAFDRGFRQYEWRWKKEEFKKINRSYSQPRWDGRPHPGKTIFIWPEQGFGDTLQFIRYVPLLRNKFRKVVVEVQKPVRTLVETIPEIDLVIPSGKPFSAFDYHLPLLSLAQYFTSDETTIPGKIPYLWPRKGGPSIPPKNGKRLTVGLAWAGRPTHENDHNRTLPFSSLEVLTGRSRVAWYSLQKGPAGRAVRNRPEIIDLSPQLKDFYDTAQFLLQMDLVITIDSAVSHLAGALGVETWVLLPYQSDWRWMYDRDDSPWYPTVTLFRQDSDCTWDPVLKKVNDRITKRIEQR